MTYVFAHVFETKMINFYIELKRRISLRFAIVIKFCELAIDILRM